MGSKKRIEIVEEHVRRENEHDLDGIMATYAGSPTYDDQPYDEHHVPAPGCAPTTSGSTTTAPWSFGRWACSTTRTARRDVS
jgi:hypothetical protein